MDWILEHLRVVIAIVGAVVFWLKQRSAAQAKNATPVRPAQPATMAAGDNEDRARKIRDEILRKIAERRDGASASSAPRPSQERAKKFELPPVMRRIPSLDSFGGPGRSRTTRTAETIFPPPLSAKIDSDEAVLARQEKLAQQMRDLEAQRASALRRATATTEAAKVAESVNLRAASQVRQELREPRAVRHAIILREVLGPPVGLR